MSRSALWRQEGNFREREQRAEEIFQEACAEGRRRANSALPLWGPDDSFHFNPLLLRNTIQSTYFQKCCETLTDWKSVIDEIYYEVKNLQPFAIDKTPSTAFCLLLRLMTLRMTAHQMDLTLKHVDSPYIRAIGFLYLRYAGPPEQMWTWIEPYVQDEEELQVDARGGSMVTMGKFVRDLFSERDYCGTPLPRLPVAMEREIKLKLLHVEKVVERAQLHFKNGTRMSHFQTLGNEVMALYGDEENPVQWYKAVVDRVITRDEASGVQLKYPRFVVTFTEYGNTETVTLGELDVLDGTWMHDGKSGSVNPRGDSRPERGYGGRGGGGARDARLDEKHLYDEVRRRERDTVTADKGWARRPPTTKSSLAQRSSHVRNDDFPQRRQPPEQQQQQQQQQQHSIKASRPRTPSPPSRGERKRTPEELAAIAEKKRKLIAKYG